MNAYKFTPERKAQCVEWVRQNGLKDNGGATVAQFLKACDISKCKFYTLLKEDAEFAEQIEQAKKDFAEQLEHDIVMSLAKAAKGYKYTKRRTEYAKDKNGNPVIKKQSTEDVEVKPDIGAAVFILTNMAPERWKNRQHNEISGGLKTESETNVNFDVTDIPEELLYEIADKLQDGAQKRIKQEKNGKDKEETERTEASGN